MPQITDEQFRCLAEIQRLARIMRQCAGVKVPAFQEAQSKLTMELNRLSTGSNIADLGRTGLGGLY